ncbi:AMP-binding protein [Massilia glaciei]|nr:AMP-binding protein [Massilia glaciei]
MKVSTPDASKVDFRNFKDELREHARTWTQSTVFARENPDGPALYSFFGNRSFLQLHQNANRVANALLALGLHRGDAIALMVRNRPEFVEVLLAAMRIGLRLTPINTHLTAREASYIVHDCQAKVLFAEDALLQAMAADVALAPPTARTIVVGAPAGLRERYEAMIAVASPELPSPLAAGTLMLYTSGTTGSPKGVLREEPEIVEPQYEGTFTNYNPLADVAMCCGPAYHAAPLLIDVRWPLASGVPLVLLEKWDSTAALGLIETHKVTHAHMVPTMFQRLLALDPTVRAAYNLSSLRFVVHGAAPCQPEVKRAMIAWFGPIITEYYGATEGGNGINVDSQQWLRKPGTVGWLNPALGHRLLGPDGNDAAPGVVGEIHFSAPKDGRFQYFGDAEKTAQTYQGDYFTLGDFGYVDEDGFLFLTGRAAECIISGGVNIYPQEVDNVLLGHPAVADACTVGAPDAEWGERVVSLVVTRPGYTASPALAEELMAWCATQLAGFKRPRKIHFETEVPRTATGKLLRKSARERFWNEAERAI